MRKNVFRTVIVLALAVWVINPVLAQETIPDAPTHSSTAITVNK